jgi:hypothetical protein
MTMPSKNSKTQEEGGVRTPPQFVKYRMTDEEIKAAQDTVDNLSDVMEIIAQFCDLGYKFSASHDDYGGGTQVFLTPSKPENPNYGWTLSARGPSLVAAFAVLVYKHFTLFGQEWPKEQQAARGQSWG